MDSVDRKSRFQDFYAFMQYKLNNKLNIGIYSGDNLFLRYPDSYRSAPNLLRKGSAAIWVESDYLPLLKSLSIQYRGNFSTHSIDSSKLGVSWINYTNKDSMTTDYFYNNYDSCHINEIKFTSLLKLNKNYNVRLQLGIIDTASQIGSFNTRNELDNNGWLYSQVWWNEYHLYDEKQYNFDIGIVAKPTNTIAYFINIGSLVGKGVNYYYWTNKSTSPDYVYEPWYDYAHLSYYCEGTISKTININNFDYNFGLKTYYIRHFFNEITDKTSYFDILKLYKNKDNYLYSQLNITIPIYINWKIFNNFNSFISWSPSFNYIFPDNDGHYLFNNEAESGFILKEASIGFVYKNTKHIQISFMPMIKLSATTFAFETLFNF